MLSFYQPAQSPSSATTELAAEAETGTAPPPPKVKVKSNNLNKSHIGLIHYINFNLPFSEI